MKKIITALIVIIFYSCIESNNKTETIKSIAEIDDYINTILKADEIPGIAIAVIKNGKLVHKKYYGYANLEHYVPVTDSTLFRVYSTTKMMTSVGVFQLIEQGKLRLEDKISKYILDLPESWKEIQIKHLLTHSSDLPEYKDLGESYSDEIIWNKVLGEKLQFKKGDHFSYNQTGFWVLKKVIEKITNKSFENFIIENQFPNAEEEVFFASNSLVAYPNRVAKYIYNHKLNRFEHSTFNAGNRSIAGNGLNVTLNQLIEWNKTLDNNTLLSNTTKQKMLDPFDYANDQKQFSYGWDIYSVNNHLKYGFSGGAVVDFKKFDTGLTVIILSNGYKYRPRIANMMRYIAGIADKSLDETERNFNEKFRVDFLSNSFENGLEIYQNRKIEFPKKSFETPLNNIGYDFLSVGELKKAINIFKLIVREYPESPNAYDSLGEAYMLNKQYQLSVKNYQKSLDLNPNNTNASKMINRMTEEIN